MNISDELVTSKRRRHTDLDREDIVYESRRSTSKAVWRLWAKSIGEKEGTTDREADKIAMIRTAIVAVNIITCFFIVAKAIT
jgi:hypothetical protein